MVLVDTSIWIRYLSNRPGFGMELDLLLERDEVAGHELVYGELLIGDPGGRSELLESFTRMHQIESLAHGEVAEFVRAHRLYGRGIGWIDAHLLASALVAGVPLWSADERLAKIAGEVGISYSPRRGS